MREACGAAKEGGKRRLGFKAGTDWSRRGPSQPCRYVKAKMTSDNVDTLMVKGKEAGVLPDRLDFPYALGDCSDLSENVPPRPWCLNTMKKSFALGEAIWL